MNYDFYGFPEEMYKVTYPAPGNVELAQEIQTSLAAELPVKSDAEWGFDHGTWVVLKYMFPKADIPVIQLSIDYSKPLLVSLRTWEAFNVFENSRRADPGIRQHGSQSEYAARYEQRPAIRLGEWSSMRRSGSIFRMETIKQ